ncbi:polymorphic toxin-type HINT domain-containing protein [Phaeacidiphilus oryzae]|uniref:polymorphic toxin-type HINT domain-containing protein n=1 Tax=Phaeacidiphilus oryzae TaxID=348818 RepID=UPI001269E8FD
MTTFTHPFYDETRNSFVETKHLHAGDLLQTPTGPARITRIHLFHAHTTTYDPTIGNLHTYYVLAGTTPVLVHNCGEDTPGLLSDSHQPIGDPNAKGGIYALVSESGEVQRTGMATNLADRLATHARTYPDLKGVVLYRTDDRAARRGLEEMAERWFTPKLAGQMAIRLSNPRRPQYLQAARDFLEQWSGRSE